MRKVIVLLAAMVLAFSFGACGNTESRQTSTPQSTETVQSKDDVSPTADAGSASDDDLNYVGMFRNGDKDGELLIINEDGTLTYIDVTGQKSVDGTYTNEGDQYHFAAENTSIDNMDGTFEGTTWHINDFTYQPTSQTGDYSSDESGDGFVIRDGIFTIYQDFEDESGKIIGTYERDGYQWIFTSPGLKDGDMTGVYDGRKWIIDGRQYQHASEVRMYDSVFTRYGIYVDGKEQKILGKKVSELEDDGFVFETDSENISVKSGAVSELEVTYENAGAKIKAVNPFEKEAPLADCHICSFYTEDTGTFQLNSEGNHCGEDNYDQLLNHNVYEYTPERLVYKRYVLPDFSFDVNGSDDPKGKQILTPSGDCDLTLNFDGSVLTSFSYVYPDLTYNELGKNVASEELDNMDAATMEGIIAVRNDILTELKAAFASANIDIDIDDISGEIVMDNNVLFALDSYELSDTGKEYIDQFMQAYASVLLSDKFAEVVSEVRFEGHTDSSGDFGYNMTLSRNRANAVLDYCLNSPENNLSDSQKSRLGSLATAVGYSSTNLIYDENGRENAEASRRVAVKFFIEVD